jgi:hypothetical protein
MRPKVDQPAISAIERDEFLSDEDLDLRNLSEEELVAYWNLWLEQAQATNDLDEGSYSHGVFETAPRS